MTANRDEAVALLAQHQATSVYGGLTLDSCSCDERPPEIDDMTWMAEHQMDVLAQAGLQPFRTTPTKGTTP